MGKFEHNRRHRNNNPNNYSYRHPRNRRSPPPPPPRRRNVVNSPPRRPPLRSRPWYSEDVRTFVDLKRLIPEVEKHRYNEILENYIRHKKYEYDFKKVGEDLTLVRVLNEILKKEKEILKEYAKDVNKNVMSL